MTWSALGPAETGGSEVLTYQLQIDDGAGGDFHVLVGELTDPFLKLSHTVYAGIEEGTTYRFRLRALNAVGWGAYSPITYIEAASTPGRPPAPRLVAAASTGVTLGLAPSSEDGGSAITGYKILRDDGLGLSGGAEAFELTGYDGTSATYEATLAGEGLVLGRVYRFVYVASNAYGDSASSLPLVAGVGAPPEVAEAPVRVVDYDLYDPESRTASMMLSWESVVVTADLGVLGYRLLVDDGLGDDDSFTVLFDSGNNPLGTEFFVSGLAEARTYRFVVEARDVNGLGPRSPAAALVACTRPAGLAAPLLLQASEDAFVVSWLQPASDGGCSTTGYSLYQSSDQDATAPSYTLLEAALPATTLDWQVTLPD